MGNEILNQADIDKLVSKLKDKRIKQSKDKDLSQEDIDSVIREYEELTNTNLDQNDIDRIIQSFDKEFKPEY